MDLIDVALSRILLENSRTPYSKMAEEVGISTQAVHRRIQSLREEGILRNTIARPSLKAMGITHVIIFGWSKSKSISHVASRLAENPLIAVMQVASGNYVYVHAGIKDADQLAKVVTFVQQEAMISSPQVGIVNGTGATDDDGLTRSDLRIISALKEDSRRSVAEVSAETGMTAKTVRKRLNRMIDEGLVSFTIHWQPDAQGDTMSKLHIVLNDEVDREKVAISLISRFSDNVINVVSFSNLPHLIMVTIWSESVRDMNRLCKSLEDDGCVESVTPFVLLDIHYYRASGSDPSK